MGALKKVAPTPAPISKQNQQEWVSVDLVLLRRTTTEAERQNMID